MRIAAHCSSIRPHNLAFSVARSPNQTVFRGTLPRRYSIRRSQRGNNSSTSQTLSTTFVATPHPTCLSCVVTARRTAVRQCLVRQARLPTLSLPLTATHHAITPFLFCTPRISVRRRQADFCCKTDTNCPLRLRQICFLHRSTRPNTPCNTAPFAQSNSVHNEDIFYTSFVSPYRSFYSMIAHRLLLHSRRNFPHNLHDKQKGHRCCDILSTVHFCL